MSEGSLAKVAAQICLKSYVLLSGILYRSSWAPKWEKKKKKKKKKKKALMPYENIEGLN